MPDFKALAVSARAGMRPAQRRRTRLKVQAWLFPVATERKYARGLEAAAAWLPEAIRELERLIGRYRADGFADDLRAWVASADAAALAMFAPDGPVLKLISEVGIDAYLFNAGQWGKATEALVGFRYSTPEGWWDDMLKDWTEENVQYLEAATAETRARASALAMRAVRTGMPAEELAAELGKVLGGYERRLKLIAADQIGNLNGMLTERRQVEAGIEVYSWQTKSDERVRGRPGGKYPDAVPSHWEMQGMWCKWSDSGVYADPDSDVVRDERGDIVSVSWHPRNALMPLAIPGEATRCRCTASPVWESFLTTGE